MQRQPIEEEEEKILQTKEVSNRSPPVSPDIEANIQSSRTGGTPLPESVRAFFEPRFVVDFSKVHVHTGADAVQMNRYLNAQSFTHGRDIYFADGRYNPSISSGKRLLAHELSHVVQQSNALGNSRIQRHQCETASLHRCPDDRVSIVINAFQQTASWLPQAKLRIENYISAPTNGRNGLAASALLRHFNWTEAIRQQNIYPDIPQIVLSIINRALNNITNPIHSFCPPAPSSDVPDRDIYAGSPTAWASTNCYEFYQPFFADTAPRGKIAIHEMMHSWEAVSDISYEGDDNYPPNVRAAQNNADSYAALIRDLG